MGCDIHSYIEYRPKGLWEFNNKPHSWDNWGQRYYVGRNYRMFGLLAGLRSGQDALFPVRGVPRDISWHVKEDYTFSIGDSDDGERSVSKETAQEWLSRGYAKYWVDGDGTENTNIITHPDWHSASWLTADELAAVIERYRSLYYEEEVKEWAAIGQKLSEDRFLTMWKVLYANLRTLEDTGFEARYVFWFDN
jgi:hypothetical protein